MFTCKYQHTSPGQYFPSLWSLKTTDLKPTDPSQHTLLTHLSPIPYVYSKPCSSISLPQRTYATPFHVGLSLLVNISVALLSRPIAELELRTGI